MADSLDVDVRASLTWLFQEQLDLSTVADASRLEYSTSLTDGAGAGEVDRLWHDQRTLAASTAEELKLSDLTSTLFGSEVNFEFGQVKALLMVNLATAADGELLVGGAAAQAFYTPFNATAAKVRLPPDSCLLLVNKQQGWTVVAGAADRLRIENTGSQPVVYRIAIAGTRPDDE